MVCTENIKINEVKIEQQWFFPFQSFNVDEPLHFSLFCNEFAKLDL